MEIAKFLPFSPGKRKKPPLPSITKSPSKT
jgi:hypothetical protein